MISSWENNHHHDNEEDIHVSLEIYETVGYMHILDLYIILHLFHVHIRLQEVGVEFEVYV